MRFYKVLRRATEEEINGLFKRGYKTTYTREDIHGAWIMHIIEGFDDRNNLVTYIPKKGAEPYTLFIPDGYIWDGQVDETSPVAKAIKAWEIKHSLSPDTRQSFDDLINTIL